MARSHQGLAKAAQFFSFAKKAGGEPSYAVYRCVGGLALFFEGGSLFVN